ncbi:nucleoporin NUP37 [Podospora aff. communis PSN243]|uniref:Nucleoporin NUP37 n=1 Tax=Podospora aff. communis PSN243 TaxID=3040156 RepID=A0AAV9GGM0_9PEZI|nr:nucleoporin NUP37 [Podospora aff. communis PSN243]
MQTAPRTRRTAQNTQYTYPIGCRVHDVKIYPVQSPQGATILLYGHANGVTIVWRGGRRLKPLKPAVKDNSNGSNSNDAVMIIDSDDDEPPAASASAPFVDKPEFEDAPPANTSIQEVVQTLDLSLGCAALNLAVLPMPHCTPEDASWNGADILQSRIVFAVVCATGDNFVVTLPLTPPSHESKARPELRQNLLAGNAGKGVWGETLCLLGGQNRAGEGIAISLVKPTLGARSKSLERTTSQSATRAIVAAHSREASGTLRFWDVPLGPKAGTLSRVEPFQTEYLPSPLTSISFNPTHITQLLTVTPSQAVRIYDYLVPSLPLDETSEGPFPSQGSWLLSLYPPFARGAASATTRKPIVAAKWVAHGHAVLALLADGQWGIWDIDGASPSSGSSGAKLFSKASAALRGSAITAFCTTGHLEGTSPLRNPAMQKSPAAPGSGEFVPMTPHTRRDAIATSITGGSDKLAAVRGGIDVTRHVQSHGTGPGDESAILWLGGADPIVSVVPVVSRFWESQMRRASGGANIWSGSSPTRMIRLTELGAGLLGERCTGAVGIPKPGRTPSGANGASTPSENDASGSDGLAIEVLLQGETRLVVIQESEDGSTLTSRLFGARKKPRTELRDTRAILAYPRPQEPGSVKFNLSISQRGALLRPRAPIRGAFDGIGEEMDVVPSTETASKPPSNPSRATGLLFANDLNYAADVPDDEEQAESRDVDQEIMDIMEIDRELEEMEAHRERGSKRVFFEEG